MGNNNNDHGDAAAEATFPVAMYVLIIANLALLLVTYADLLYVISLMSMVNYTSVYVMLLWVLNLLRNFLIIYQSKNLICLGSFHRLVLLLPSNRVHLHVRISKDGRLRQSCG
jgi:hypothetical protein